MRERRPSISRALIVCKVKFNFIPSTSGFVNEII